MRPGRNSLRLLPSGPDRVGEMPVRPASRADYIRSSPPGHKARLGKIRTFVVQVPDPPFRRGLRHQLAAWLARPLEKLIN